MTKNYKFNRRKKNIKSTFSGQNTQQASTLVESLKNLTVAEFIKASKFQKNIFQKKFNKNKKYPYQKKKSRGKIKNFIKKRIKFLRKRNKFIKLNLTFPFRWFILSKFFSKKRLKKRLSKLKRLRRFRYLMRLKLRFFTVIARLKRKLFYRIKSNRYFFFNKYKCLVSLNYPSLVWIRRRKKFNLFITLFLKKKYSLLSRLEEDSLKRNNNLVAVNKYYQRKRNFILKKLNRRLRSIRKLFKSFCIRSTKQFAFLRRRKFVSFFNLRLKKYKKDRLIYNFLYFLKTKKNRIKNLKLLFLRFFFVKFSYKKQTNKFFRTFITCFKRPVLFRYRQGLAKATRRYRTRYLRRRTKSRLGVYGQFRVNHRFLSKFVSFTRRLVVPKTRRTWIKNYKFYKGKCISKGYWAKFQPPPVLRSGFRFRWFLFRPIKKVQFLKDFSRRRWQNNIWLWRSKENRRRLRNVFKFTRFGLNRNSFSHFYLQYFGTNSVFSTMLFSVYKKNSHVPLVFEFDVYKFFVLNFLSFSSISSRVFEELGILPKVASSLLFVSRNKLLSTVNQSQKPVSFLVVYLMHKKQKSINALFDGLTSLRLQTKKRRIALLKRDSSFVKARREITLKKDKKSWFNFLKWRNWKRRFSPLLFKTVSMVKNLSIYNYVLLLSKQLKIFSNTALQLGGFLKNFSLTSSKCKGFSFIKRWFYRNLGKRLRLPFQKKTYRRFRKILLQRRLVYRLKKFGSAKKNIIKDRKIKHKSLKTKFLKNKKNRLPTFEERFAGYKKKNLLYKFFSTRFATGLFKMRRVVWSEADLRNISRKYKRRLYSRILQKVPLHERVYFRPWSLRWWDFYNKRFIRAKNEFIAGLITSLGIVVKVTLNNVFVGVVDDAGSPFTVWSAGSVGFKGPTKKTTTAVDLLLEEVFGFAQKIGFDSFKVAFASSPTSFLAKRFLGSFTRPHLSVQSVSFCGKLPHNGVRARRQKRR
jgi:ribosomal protein S11